MADTQTQPKARKARAPMPKAKASTTAPKAPGDTQTQPKASKRKFDPLKAHGVITPPYKGAVFEQDGGYFGPGGDLIWEDHPPTKSGKTVTHTTTVHDADTGETTETTEVVEVDDREDADPKAVLKMWLKGELDPVPSIDTLRALTKKGYGEVLATKEEIVDFLVNRANLVPAEQVKVS